MRPGRGAASVALAAGVLLSAFGALPGCVSNDAYPSQWAAVRPGFRCADLAGTYRDLAEASSPGTPELHLSALLGVPPAKDASPTTVRLDVDAMGRVSAEIARVSFGGGAREPLRPSLDLVCRDGAVSHAASAPASRDGLFIGSDARALAYARGADGALVLHASERFAGTLLVVVPVAGATSAWYRFAAVSPDAAR